MGRYAEGTTVPVAKTQAEIEQTLKRYGATAFARMEEGPAAMIGFKMQGYAVRMSLVLPAEDDRRFTRTARGRPRTAAQTAQAHAQELRRVWRVLLLRLKAKLEAIDDGVPFAEEFLPYLCLPSGQTVGDEVLSQVDQGIAAGQMSPLLLPVGQQRT